MPAIPQSTRDSITGRLLLHAREHWPQLKKVQASYRGSFAYITGILPDGEQVPLFRLRYGGSAHSFGFAIYSAARDRYEDAVLLTGLLTGTPQEALDTAATVHLTAIGHEPPQNLRCHPLSLLRVPAGIPGMRRSLLRDMAEGWADFRSRTWPWAAAAAFSCRTGSASLAPR